MDKYTLLSELARLPGRLRPAFTNGYHEEGEKPARSPALRKSPTAPEQPRPRQNPQALLDCRAHVRLRSPSGAAAAHGSRPPLRRNPPRLRQWLPLLPGGNDHAARQRAPLEQIIEIARQGIASSGYDEVSLLSLSSADYTLIGPLVRAMSDEFGTQGVSVSLPSLRINGFDVSLVDDIARIRKSGFTFAPEAGTERLRDVINKPVNEETFRNTIEDVF